MRDAWIEDSTGKRVVDFARHNLHVVGYSVPVRKRVSLAELRPHLFTLPGPSGLDPLPHLLLRRDLGLLPDARPAARAR